MWGGGEREAIPPRTLRRGCPALSKAIFRTFLFGSAPMKVQRGPYNHLPPSGFPVTLLTYFLSTFFSPSSFASLRTGGNTSRRPGFKPGAGALCPADSYLWFCYINELILYFGGNPRSAWDTCPHRRERIPPRHCTLPTLNNPTLLRKKMRKPKLPPCRVAKTRRRQKTKLFDRIPTARLKFIVRGRN